MKAYIFKYFLLITFFLTGNFSCSLDIDPVGIYVHYRETQKYYTLAIKRKNENNYKLKFEGVPLDNFESTPWSYKCSGKLKSSKIKCDNVTLTFPRGKSIVEVKYSDAKKQVFINSEKDIKEDLTKFNIKNENRGK